MSDNSGFWWKEEDPSSLLVEHIHKLRQEQSYRRDSLMLHLQLYTGQPISDIGLRNYARGLASNGMRRSSLNVVQSVCDTVIARIGKNKPIPQFITTEAAHELQNKAKVASQAIIGEFDRNKVYTKGRRAFAMACIDGTGVVKVYTQNNRVVVENITLPREELLVDDCDAFYGDPQCLYQTKYINREVLKAQFPEYEKKIDAADPGGANYYSFRDLEQIEVNEAWHLPSGPDADDGRHCIVIDDCTLFDEDYTENHYPFAFIRWIDSPIGFWGRGLAEQLASIQMEINLYASRIYESIYLLGTPKLFIEKGCLITDCEWDNSIGQVIRYNKGSALPKLETFQAVHPQVFNHLEWLYQKGYQLPGVSPFSAQSIKPAGLESEPSIMAFNETESERHAIPALAYEDFFLEIAKLIIGEIKRLNKDSRRSYESTYVDNDKGFIKQINWDEVDLDETSYKLRIVPVGFLTGTWAGKAQKALTMLQMGVINKETTQKLLQLPDIEAVQSLELASERNLDRMAEILEEGGYVRPEPFHNLIAGMRKMQLLYNKCQVNNASEEILANISQWLEEAKALLDRAAQPAPQPAPPGQPPPEAGPLAQLQPPADITPPGPPGPQAPMAPLGPPAA